MIRIQILDNLFKSTLFDHIYFAILFARHGNQTLKYHDLSFDIIGLQCFQHDPDSFFDPDHVTNIVRKVIFIRLVVHYIHFFNHKTTDDMAVHSKIQNTSEIAFKVLSIANIFDRFSTQTTDRV